MQILKGIIREFKCPNCGRRLNNIQVFRTYWPYPCPHCRSVLVGSRRPIVECLGGWLLTLLSIMQFGALHESIFAWVRDMARTDESGTVVFYIKLYGYMSCGLMFAGLVLFIYGWGRLFLRVADGTGLEEEL